MSNTTPQNADKPVSGRPAEGSAQPLSDAHKQATELLANRLRTLMDISEARTGVEITFASVSEFLSGRGLSLSRARWSYIINAHRYVDDLELLDAISDYFNVPHGYLRGDEQTPDQVSAELDLVRAMRASKVRTFAARTLGDLSPETLGAITKFLDKEAARAGGTQIEN